MTNLFVIIPIYNDVLTIRAIVDSLFAAGYTNIIIVDDGSVEDVYTEIADKNLHYLRHAINLGQGAALQTGFDYALMMGADVVVTFDADGQHDWKDIEFLIDPIIRNQVDITLGSRFLGKSDSGLSISRLFILKGARIVNFIFSGIFLTDAHNGLRGLSRKAMQCIRITENRMAHASEIIFEIRKYRLRFKEISVNVKYTEYSKIKGQSGWSSIKILTDLILYRLRKRDQSLINDVRKKAMDDVKIVEQGKTLSKS